MNEIDDGGPAFAMGVPEGNFHHSYTQHGMTLRQWYAGMFLSSFTIYGKMDAAEVARICFGVADAMIAEGKKR